MQATKNSDALIIIDMQEAYFNDERLHKQKRPLINAIQRQIEEHIQRGSLIINVRTIHTAHKDTWTLNMLEDDQGFLFENTDETTTLLKIPDTTIQIEKTRDSAFHETTLYSVLREHRCKTLTLVGVSAHTCIFHTASAAYAYNFHVTLVRDAIGDEDTDAMERSLDYLQKEYRQTIS
jgi:nicotinamidase-related amidase